MLILISAFTIWSGFSLIWARSPGVAVCHTLTWSLYITYLVIFIRLVRLGSGVRILVGAFSLIALILGVLCLIDYLAIVDFKSVEGALRTRYAGSAELFVTVSPVLVVATLYVRDKRGLLFLRLAAILSWITVMLSLSKGAFISGILGFIILFAGCAFFSTRRIRKKILVMASVWFAITLGLQIFLSSTSSIPSTTDYITGVADKTRSTTKMRLFTWNVAGQMVANHWLIGVGADNFGIEFNAARADLAAKNPTATGEGIVEDYIAERAHNEFLQIFTELGTVGILLFGGGFGYFAFMTAKYFRLNKHRLSPIFWAAIAGNSAFLVSSLFSSFSFRTMQNGLVFFMVFALAMNELSKMSRIRTIEGQDISTPSRTKLVGAFAIVFAALAVVFFSSKPMAEYYVYRAEHSQGFDDSERHFRSALRIDPDDAPAYLSFSKRCAANGRYTQAAALLREAMDRGLGDVLNYTVLVEIQSLSGDAAGAEKTFNEGILIFPRSVFMRVSYAVFLEKHGRPIDSARQMEFARGIDIKQANGWRAVMKGGTDAAFDQARTDPKTAPPADLRPESAVSRYRRKPDVSGPDRRDSNPTR